ncbi:hypothetical protein EDB86DRAFT_2271913 [Lactarius hatsudake]|nr:hypothetical protein EDB86DRAFT_2271913 [Lactarius hatsudake]
MVGVVYGHIRMRHDSAAFRMQSTRRLTVDSPQIQGTKKSQVEGEAHHFGSYCSSRGVAYDHRCVSITRPILQVLSATGSIYQRIHNGQNSDMPSRLPSLSGMSCMSCLARVYSNLSSQEGYVGHLRLFGASSICTWVKRLRLFPSCACVAAHTCKRTSSPHVLYALSATLGEGVGLAFPPAKVIFSGIGILLAAAKDVRASHDALVDLFGRTEGFFKRLKVYTETSSATDFAEVLVNVVVEVLNILSIADK